MPLEDRSSCHGDDKVAEFIVTDVENQLCARFRGIGVFNSYYLNPCSCACYSLSKHQESSSVSSDGNLMLTFIIGYG